MYRLKQQTDIDFSPCYLKNSRRHEELYEFLINDKEEVLQHPPTLIADGKLTLESVQKLDYLESFLPAPIFSERAKMRMEGMVEGDVVFYPCKISLKGEALPFYFAKILRRLPILDIENCSFRTLSNGKRIPTSPYKFSPQEVEFTFARDSYYPSLFVVSSELQKEIHDLSLHLISLV